MTAATYFNWLDRKKESKLFKFRKRNQKDPNESIAILIQLMYNKKYEEGKNMSLELIPIQFNKILQSQNYTVFILGTQEKQFAIYTSAYIGKNLQIYLADQIKPRPCTHDLIHSIFNGLNIQLLQVVITDVKDTLYFARIFIEQRTDNLRNILEIDARPSDCLTLALENNIPIYCTKEAFNKTIAVDE